MPALAGSTDPSMALVMEGTTRPMPNPATETELRGHLRVRPGVDDGDRGQVAEDGEGVAGDQYGPGAVALDQRTARQVRDHDGGRHREERQSGADGRVVPDLLEEEAEDEDQAVEGEVQQHSDEGRGTECRRPTGGGSIGSPLRRSTARKPSSATRKTARQVRTVAEDQPCALASTIASGERAQADDGEQLTGQVQRAAHRGVARGAGLAWARTSTMPTAAMGTLT